MIIKFFFFLLIGICTEIFGQTSSVENKISAAVDTYNSESVELLKEVININSGTLNFEGVKKVGAVFQQEFNDLGFQTRWAEGASFNRAGHLVATHRGTGNGSKLLLIGHLDTVFEPDSPFQTYTVDGDTLHGPGVADMKGGDVIIILALKALKENGILDKMNIDVIYSGDEERMGGPTELARKDLIESAQWADIALAFENGDGDPKTAVISRRGSLSWTLKVKGMAAHSSQIFTEQVGMGAIYEASRILNSFYEQLKTEEYLTFNPGVIFGGTTIDYESFKSTGSAYGKRNVVAEHAIVEGDLRALSPQQLEKAKSVMLKIASENYPQTSAILTFKETSYPPLAPTTGNKQLLEKYSRVSEDLGFGKVTAVNPRDAGAADISFTSGLVDMALDGMGMSGANDHTVNETGIISALSVQAKRAAVLMYRLSLEEKNSRLF